MPDLQTPQDMIKVFAETQKNMMELNRSSSLPTWNPGQVMHHQGISRISWEMS